MLGSAFSDSPPMSTVFQRAAKDQTFSEVRIGRERLTDRSVANIVKAYAERAGFDASLFSGH
jgi:hypothetical protein